MNAARSDLNWHPTVTSLAQTITHINGASRWLLQVSVVFI